jgi:hypothetical protein
LIKIQTTKVPNPKEWYQGILFYNFTFFRVLNYFENFVGSVSMSFLDTPATTSATIYKVQFKNENASGTVFVQKDSINLTTSTIYLMEVTP